MKIIVYDKISGKISYQYFFSSSMKAAFFIKGYLKTMNHFEYEIKAEFI